MNELNFPSGPWIGFYNYNRAKQERHRQDLVLTFVGGQISGSGTEKKGKFSIRGGYAPRTGECYWTKTYIGGHDVFYRGFREGRGIWGKWELNWTHGGFHIWPLSEGTELALVAGKTKTQPAVESVQKPKILILSAVEGV